MLEKKFLFRLALLVLAGLVIGFTLRNFRKRAVSQRARAASPAWHAPDTSLIPHDEQGDLIRYGRDLIANTASYLGPKGSVRRISNPMDCQNCHLDAGLKPYGNCFSAVASIYPTFRPRSGIIESIEFRINDCLQRSMNGKMLDSASTEMRAMVAYLKWVGKDVAKGERPEGAGVIELPYLERAADTVKGKNVYFAKCRSCHGLSGEGIADVAGGYVYPPLWGADSYNTGAGLYRLSRFAGYVKYSMPLGVTYGNSQLSDEEAWDVAAFVNSQPRPVKVFPKDWPNLMKQAIDSPTGPYVDHFSEMQHKYGPFGPIKAVRDSLLAIQK